MKNDFLVAITQLSAEKNLPREAVLEAVELALASAYKKDEVHANNVRVRVDRETGAIHVFAMKVAADEVEDDREQMDLAEARKFNPAAVVGDEIEYEVAPRDAGRIAAQTAKQVVLQRLREAEREIVFDEYADREGDVISGVIQRVEPRQVIVDLGKTEAVMPSAEQVRNEHYRAGQRMKFYIAEVFRANKGPQVVVSRSDKNLVRRLFELEVPEIFRGAVELMAVAREPGSRTKVAVHSRQDGIDAVGACVGLRGVRIQNIVNELQGERIDVIQWDHEPIRFVANALSPAQVLSVRIVEAENTAYVVVPDGQLSLAIGREGQNARLAAKLTRRRIDIISRTAAEEVYGGELAPPAPEVPVEAVAPEPALAAAPRAAEPAVAVAEAATAAEPAPVVGAGPAPAGYEDEVEEIAPAEAAEDGSLEPVAAAFPPEPGRAQPQIRFAEDILGAPSPRRVKPDHKGKRVEADEAELRAKPLKKKRATRVAFSGDDGDEELEDIEYPGLGGGGGRR